MPRGLEYIVGSREFMYPPAVPLDLEAVLMAFGMTPVMIPPGIGSAPVFLGPSAASTSPEYKICACDVCTSASLNVLKLMAAFNIASS